MDIAVQSAEIGVILLMFGVGLHFHLKDLLAVRKIAIPGALVQIAAATVFGMGATWLLDWTWQAGMVFGMAISVASTVVLTRVLTDRRVLHTPSGHIAIGWLIVEDLFTILVLVLLPALVGKGADSGDGFWMTLGISLAKLAFLIAFSLIAGQRIIPWILGYIARTGSRELFTLAILVIALGLAVGSAKLFGASMALGAFLAGMIVGQSDYSTRAASDALPMKDAFAVLFFVSVGMLFDPMAVQEGWVLILVTTAIVLIGKPLAALVVVLGLKRSLKEALTISIALAQIGEFSFILAAMATDLKILPKEATNALVVAALVSIILNPILFSAIDPLGNFLEKIGLKLRKSKKVEDAFEVDEAGHPTIVVGHGPVGQTLSKILMDVGVQVFIIEMNIDTVQSLKAEGIPAIYGNAASREVLTQAKIKEAESIIITVGDNSAFPIVQAAKELNPTIQILTRASFLKEVNDLKTAGAHAVFTSEGEIALSMAEFLMRQFGSTEEQIDNEREYVRREIFSDKKPDKGDLKSLATQ